MSTDAVSTEVANRSYSIREAAQLTGLPASTLRYYESIGLITPIDRGATSKHRAYSEDDLHLLTAVSCLHATGMGLDKMRRYLANVEVGESAAPDQIRLLTEQDRQLTLEAGRLAVRHRYVQLKIAYWQAISDGDTTEAEDLAGQARGLIEQLKASRPQ